MPNDEDSVRKSMVGRGDGVQFCRVILFWLVRKIFAERVTEASHDEFEE